jgi:hypothetical protein
MKEQAEATELENEMARALREAEKWAAVAKQQSVRACQLREWGEFFEARLAPLGITEEEVFGCIGKGKLADPKDHPLGTGQTQRIRTWFIEFDELRARAAELGVGIEIKNAHRIPSRELLESEPNPPIARFPDFGAGAVKFYDLLIIKGVKPARKSYRFRVGVVPTVFNKQAAEIVAATVNVLGCDSRPWSARDVINRLAADGRRSTRSG